MDKHMQPCKDERPGKTQGSDTQHGRITLLDPATGEVVDPDEAASMLDVQLMRHGTDILLHVHMKSGMSQAHAEESINVIAKAMRTYAQQGVIWKGA
jgi:hypothetical protein